MSHLNFVKSNPLNNNYNGDIFRVKRRQMFLIHSSKFINGELIA